jgi:hypothetical protein
VEETDRCDGMTCRRVRMRPSASGCVIVLTAHYSNGAELGTISGSGRSRACALRRGSATTWRKAMRAVAHHEYSWRTLTSLRNASPSTRRLRTAIVPRTRTGEWLMKSSRAYDRPSVHSAYGIRGIRGESVRLRLLIKLESGGLVSWSSGQGTEQAVDVATLLARALSTFWRPARQSELGQP